MIKLNRILLNVCWVFWGKFGKGLALFFGCPHTDVFAVRVAVSHAG
jgi:hypothetical protein